MSHASTMLSNSTTTTVVRMTNLTELRKQDVDTILSIRVRFVQRVVCTTPTI